MSNPFYFSGATYDLIQGTPQSSFNILMNMGMANAGVRGNLATGSLFNLGACQYYPTSSSPSWLIDPWFATAQCMRNINQNFSWNMPSFNNMWSNLGWGGTPFGGGIIRTPNETKKSPEDEKIERKITNLLKLLDELIATGELGEKGYPVRDNIDAAINKVKKGDVTPEGNETETAAKYRVLKAAYDAIDATAIRKGLAKLDGTNQELRNSGYEFNSSPIDSKRIANMNTEIDEAVREITNMKKAGGAGEPPNFISHIGGTYDILEALSRWNSQGKENIIDLLTNGISDESGAKASLETSLNTVVNHLIAKADEIINATDGNARVILDNDTITNIKAQVKAVKDSSNNTLKNNFNKLYITLRLASAEIARQKLIAKYDFLVKAEDEKVFDKDLFVKATKDDLKQEGFTDSDINNVTITTNKPQGFNNENKGTKTEAEKIAEMVQNNIAEEIKDDKLTALKTALGDAYDLGNNPVYMIKDINGKVSKIVILKEDKLSILPVKVKDNGEFEVQDDAELQEVTAQKLNDEYQTAKKVKASTQELDALTEGDNAILVKLKYTNGGEYYAETTKTGLFNGKQYERRYYVSENDGKIYEVKYYEKEGEGLYTMVQNDQKATEITANDIKNRISPIFKAKLNDGEVDYAKAHAQKLYKHIDGNTTNKDKRILNDYIKANITDRNILQVFYEYSKEYKKSDLFAKLLKEKYKEREDFLQTLATHLKNFITANSWAYQDADTKAEIEIIKTSLENISANSDATILSMYLKRLFQIFGPALVK